MSKRSMTPLLAALGGLALSFLVTPAAQAAVLATAHTRSQPTASAFRDDGRGTTSLLDLDSTPTASGVAAQFADTDWVVYDNGLLKVFNTSGQQVLGTLCWWNELQTLFLPHFHLPSLVVDGTIVRDPNDRTQGEANVWISQIYNDGSWQAMNVRV